MTNLKNVTIGVAACMIGMKQGLLGGGNSCGLNIETFSNSHRIVSVSCEKHGGERRGKEQW
jgi:hypothetical protein